MAQKDSNHSSKDRTILWIILPCTVAVSLLFTKLNHSVVTSGEKMSADFSAAPVAKAPQKVVTTSDTTHQVSKEAVHTGQDAGNAHH